MQNNYQVLKPGEELWNRVRRHITNGEAERSFINVKCEHIHMVNDLPAAQFVTINVDGTVTSSDTCVVISRPSRIQ